MKREARPADSPQHKRQPNVGVRKDKQTLHAMRHPVLSRFQLQALARLGEKTCTASWHQLPEGTL